MVARKWARREILCQICDLAVEGVWGARSCTLLSSSLPRWVVSRDAPWGAFARRQDAVVGLCSLGGCGSASLFAFKALDGYPETGGRRCRRGSIRGPGS
jgi:hypothetical protein